eukprot:TRINITY_DN1872_c0_g1_i3.p1 TRINITY_DN1872_c0_g1~~TRINITY_DN1872_c0_g1_i3.p1  ORF type:complete len:148 (+),score=25.54 TRINITY_DN1872_c0_g1_i3:407-850(+)
MQQELIQEGEDEESDDDIFASEMKRKHEDSPKSADVQEAEAAAPELILEEEEVESGTVQVSGENVPSPMESFDVTFEERDKTILQNFNVPSGHCVISFSNAATNRRLCSNERLWATFSSSISKLLNIHRLDLAKCVIGALGFGLFKK